LRPPAAATAARAADRALDAGVAAFAAWTVVYDVCLLAHVGTDAALAAWVVLVAAGAVAWWRIARTRRPAGVPATAPADVAVPRRRHRIAGLALLGVAAVLAVSAGVALGTGASYLLTWILWVAAAAAALLRAGLQPRDERTSRVTLVQLGVVAAWIAALALLSLFIRNTDADDTFYVHQSAWIAAHGVFPLHDTVFSNDVLPALYFPPVFSYEPLTGAVARLLGIGNADLIYFVVPPLGSALSVLAFWRLLRSWRVPFVSLALTTAIAFLLFDAGLHTGFGQFFVSRMWQGKVLLLVIVLPYLLARLHEQVYRGGGRGLVALGLTGTAAVGLSTTAIFVVPVAAAGALLPMAARAPRRAALALVAACAYPVAAGIVTKAAHGRTPDVYTAADVVSSKLVGLTLGSGALAFLALAAILLAPALLPRATAGMVTAGVALLLGLLLAPHVPEAIFDFSGLGRVLWRLTWAAPVAASVGALAVCLIRRPAVVGWVPAVALCVALALGGTPVWTRDAGSSLASHPVLKLDPAVIGDADWILARARPGDLILAPRPLSQTLMILSGTVTTVSPRGFFTRALSGQPSIHAPERRYLSHVARYGLTHVPATPREIAHLRGALRTVGVDAVCVPRWRVAVRQAVEAAGFVRWTGRRHVACLRRPG
jgi:hypothetical protein